MSKGFKSRFTRRSFLMGLGASAALPILAACQPQVVERTVEVPVVIKETVVVEKIVEMERIVEKPVEIEKEVIVEKEVERVVIVEPTALPPVEMNFWYGKPEFRVPLQNIMKLFRLSKGASHINITVTTFPNDVAEAKLKTALAAGVGQAPDFWADQGRPILDERSKEGNFLELTGRVDQSLMLPIAKDQMTVEGKLWGIAAGTFAVGLGYDVDLFDDNGFKVPTTWDEFDLLCQDVQDIGHQPMIAAGKDLAHTYWYFLGMTASALGNDGYVELTQGMRKLTDDENVTAWSRIVNWAEKGWIQKGFLGTGYEEAKALFANNQCAFASAGPDDFKGYLQVNPNGNWLWFPYPASPFTNKSAHVSGTDPNWFAYSKTDYPDEAVRFLDWAVHVEGQTAFMDLYGGLPAIKNMEIDDPVRSAMNRTPETMPGWWQRRETVNTGGPMGKNQAALFGGQMSLEEYAGEVQATIDELRM